MFNKVRSAIYTNSTDSNGTENQTEICLHRVDNDIHGIVAYYHDSDSTTSDFTALISDAKIGMFNFIFTSDVRNFGSDLKETLRIVRELKNFGIAIHFINNNICTNKLADELVLQLASNYPANSYEVRGLLQYDRT